METDDEVTDSSTYRGLPGAFRYAFRESDSRLFRAYAVLGGLLAVLVAVLFALSLVVLMANTLSGPEGTLSLLRSFFVLAGLLVVLPIVAPVLLVARHHRGGSQDTDYDRRLATTGFAFLFAVYAGLIVSTPPDQQASTDGALGPLLEALYALPQAVGLVPPVVAAAAIYGAHRALR